MWTQQCRRALWGRGWEVREPLRAEGWRCVRGWPAPGRWAGEDARLGSPGWMWLSCGCPPAGRCVDLHGAHGHVPGQVLSEGARQGHDDPRRHSRGDRCVCKWGWGGVPMVVSWAELGPPCGLQLWPCSWAAALGSPRCPHPGPEPSCSGDPRVLEPHRFSRARISGPSCASPEFRGHRKGLSVHSFLILKMLGGSSQRHAVRGENHGSVS